MSACEQADRDNSDALREVAGEDAGDTIYAVDRVSEEVLIEFFANEIAVHAPLVLIAEGVDGGRTHPAWDARGAVPMADHNEYIDGTRGLMYQKRSAWILTGVARNRGAETDLQDIELAVQTELPRVNQHLCDVLWAVRQRPRSRST